MQVFDRLNKNPVLAAVTLVVLLLLAGVLFFSSSSKRTLVSHDGQVFYTVDDGASWFADVSTRIPPFDHDGKAAVRAFIFQAGNGKPFAAYLMRYSVAAKKLLDADPKALPKIDGNGKEFKKALSKSTWASLNTKEGSEAQTVIGPSGQTDITPVEP